MHGSNTKGFFLNASKLTCSKTNGRIDDSGVIILLVTAEILGGDVSTPKYAVVVKTVTRMSIGSTKYIAHVAFALFVICVNTLVVLQILMP